MAYFGKKVGVFSRPMGVFSQPMGVFSQPIPGNGRFFLEVGVIFSKNEVGRN